jgi:hypothetical protein
MYKKSFLTLAALLVFLFAYAYLINAQQETLPGTSNKVMSLIETGG